MSGILIGEKHTEKDWGLMWVDFAIPPADPMTYTFEVPGRNGVIDVTDRMGGVKYRNRQLTFTFIRKDISSQDWHTLYSEIANYCHGKQMKLTLDSDSGFYWNGRIVVESSKEDQIHSVLTLVMDAEPYKYEVLQSTEPWTWNQFNFRVGIIRKYANLVVNSLATTNIVGAAQDVVPTLICSKAMTLTFGGKTYSLIAGENRNFDIVLKSGVNEMKFTCSGSATVSILFRGCSL